MDEEDNFSEEQEDVEHSKRKMQTPAIGFIDF